MNDAVNMTEMIVDICTTHDRASAEQHVREAIAAIAAAARAQGAEEGRAATITEACAAIDGLSAALYAHAQGPYVNCRKAVAALRSRAAKGGEK